MTKYRCLERKHNERKIEKIWRQNDRENKKTELKKKKQIEEAKKKQDEEDKKAEKEKARKAEERKKKNK